MFGFKEKKTGTVYAALIDIGSGSIGVAIAVSNPTEALPTLIYTNRIHTRISEHTEEDAGSIRRIREALLSATLTLSQEGTAVLEQHERGAKISKIYVTCTSPWSHTISRNVQYESETPFKITQKLLSDLVQSAEDEIFTHITNEPHIPDAEFEVVERATVDILVNDYRITNPLNVTGVSLSLSHIAGLIPSEIIKTLYEVQDKLFPHTQMHIHTYMLATYCVLRDFFPKVHSSCIIDITGEAIEFGIVENNLLIENTFIPVGSGTFTRDIIAKTKKPSSDILSRIRAFTQEDNALSADLKEHIETYVQHLEKGIGKILEHRILPSDIIITTHQSYEKLFRHIIEEALRRVKPSNSRIISIESNVIDQIAHGADGDVYLALGAGFFHKLNGGASTGES